MGQATKNVMELIDQCDLFVYQKGNLSHEQALAEQFPSERHYDAVLRSKVSSHNAIANARVLGLAPMEYVGHRYPISDHDDTTLYPKL